MREPTRYINTATFRAFKLSHPTLSHPPSLAHAHTITTHLRPTYQQTATPSIIVIPSIGLAKDASRDPGRRDSGLGGHTRPRASLVFAVLSFVYLVHVACFVCIILSVASPPLGHESFTIPAVDNVPASGIAFPFFACLFLSCSVSSASSVSHPLV